MPNIPHNIPHLVQTLVSQLTPDLLQPKYRAVNQAGNGLYGHCSVAAESLYHLLGAQESGWVPQNVQHESASHWFLKHRQTGVILDPTAGQFKTPVPYHLGRGRGFPTPKQGNDTQPPSRRAQVLIDRVRNKLAEANNPLDPKVLPDEDHPLTEIKVPDDSQYVDEDKWVETKYRRGGEAELRKIIQKEKLQKNWSDALDHNPTLATLYRSYKHTPHQPDSLMLKYLINRAENEEFYRTASPKDIKAHENDWMLHHQMGGAQEKNGHIKIEDLRKVFEHKPNLVKDLRRHQAKLHDFLKTHSPWTIKDIDGEPHLALARGYGVSNPAADHDVSSYADDPRRADGFGGHTKHWWVPLRNIWYSYDHGPRSASSENFGPEDEFLASNHARVEATEEDVQQAVPRDFYGAKEVPDEWKARNPNLPPEELDRLVAKSGPYHLGMDVGLQDGMSVLHHVVGRSDLTPQHLDTLRKKLSGLPPFKLSNLLSQEKLHPDLQDLFMGKGIDGDIARHPNLRPDLQVPLARAATDDIGLGLREDLTSEAQQVLLDKRHPSELNYLARNPALDHKHIPALVDAGALVRRDTGNMNVLHSLAARKDVPEDTYWQLLPHAESELVSSGNKDGGIYRALAGNPAIPMGIQTRLTNSRAVDDRGTRGPKWPWTPMSVGETLLRNPNLHPDVQRQVIYGEDDRAKALLAGHPNLRPGLHAALLDQSPPLDEDQLEMLANPNWKRGPGFESPDWPKQWYIAYRLAQNPNLHPDLHSKLAAHRSPVIHEALASNPNLLPDVQDQLLGEFDSGKVALMTNQEHAHLTAIPNALARNPALRPDLQARLAKRSEYHLSLANNPNLHPDVQMHIAQNGGKYATRALAAHPNLHPDVVAHLSQHPDQETQDELNQNTKVNLPPKTKFEARQTQKHGWRRTEKGLHKSEDDLQKGLGGLMAGIALAAGPGPKQLPQEHQSPILAAIHRVSPRPAVDPMQVTPQGPGKWTPKGMSADMLPIAHLESSFGQNMNHAKGRGGDFDTAYGPVGLKPMTGHDQWLKTPALRQKHPGLEDPAEFTKRFKSDWAFHNEVASSHFKTLQQRHKDLSTAVFAWRYGSTAAANATPETIAAEPYVQKYHQLSGKVGVAKPQLAMAKAERKTAAYRHRQTGQIVDTGMFHDETELPNQSAKGWEAGFVDSYGGFEPWDTHLPKRRVVSLAHAENATRNGPVMSIGGGPMEKAEGSKLEQMGYKFKVSHLKDRFGNVHNTTVSVTHPDAYKQYGDDKVGSVDFGHHEDALIADQVWVHHNHQRQGIARHMYHLAQEATGKAITPSSQQTHMGSMFWLHKAETHPIDHDHLLNIIKEVHDPVERGLALKHAHIQPHHLRAALEDEDPNIRERAILHHQLPPEMLNEVLLSDEDHHVQTALSRPDLTEAQLRMVAFNPTHTHLVLHHPACTEALRHDIAHHDDAPTDARFEAVQKNLPALQFPGLGVVETNGIHHSFDQLKVRHGMDAQAVGQHLLDRLQHDHPDLHEHVQTLAGMTGVEAPMHVLMNLHQYLTNPSHRSMLDNKLMDGHEEEPKPVKLAPAPRPMALPLDHPDAPHPHDNQMWVAGTEPVVKSEVMALVKSSKDAMAMYKPEHPGASESKAHVKWAYSKMPNENWSLWTVRHHRDNPQDFTPEVKSKLEHFAGSAHIPEIANVKFDKTHDLKTGLGMLEQAEKLGNDRIRSSLSLAPMPATAKKLVDTGDGHAWWSLGKQKCSDEGKAMGHCGNAGSPQKGDNVLSLRKEHTIGGVKYYEPKLTFIQNKKFIGEMKGRGNNKPAPHYHPHISQLIEKTGLIPVGGGYKPENNFDVRDLDEATFNDLVAKRPALGVLRGESTDIHHQAFDKAGKIPSHLAMHLANAPNIHVGLQRKLAGDENAGVRTSLASNPNLHLSLHDSLANDDKYVRRGLAQNPNLNPAVHTQLAGDGDDDVRWLLALNPNLNPDLHAQLAGDESGLVRRGLAQNPNLNPAVHTQLAGDKSIAVRENLAKNPNFRDEVHQGTLAQDPHPDVRAALASNPNLSNAYYGYFAGASEDDWGVHEALAGNPNLPVAYHEKLADAQQIPVQTALAGNPNLDPALHHKLARDDMHWATRKALASNPNLNPAAQVQLANAEGSDVRGALAQNPNLNPDLHAKLAVDQSIAGVRWHLASNPKISPEAQLILANDPNTTRFIIGVLQTNPNLTRAARKVLDARIEQIMAAQGNP